MQATRDQLEESDASEDNLEEFSLPYHYRHDTLAVAQTAALFRDRPLLVTNVQEQADQEAREAEEESPGLTYPSPNELSACALYWQQQGNKPDVLLAMAVGMSLEDNERPCDDGDDRMLADFTQEPYVSLSQNSSYSPRQKTFAAEVARRRSIQMRTDASLKPLACSGWVKSRALAWLYDNVVALPNDVEFLRREEPKIHRVLMNVLTTAKEQERRKASAANWGSYKPWLRLYCCIFSDEALEAFLGKDFTFQNAEQTDARNTEEFRPETFEEVVCRLYNDHNFICITEPLASRAAILAAAQKGVQMRMR